jgi:hypothetical protein
VEKGQPARAVGPECKPGVFLGSVPIQQIDGPESDEIVTSHIPHESVAAERQASAGARDGVKGEGTISLRALRCMR